MGSADGLELKLQTGRKEVRIGEAISSGEHTIKVETVKLSNSSWLGVVFADTNLNSYAGASTGCALGNSGTICSRTIQSSGDDSLALKNGSVVKLRICCAELKVFVSVDGKE